MSGTTGAVNPVGGATGAAMEKWRGGSRLALNDASSSRNASSASGRMAAGMANGGAKSGSAGAGAAAVNCASPGAETTSVVVGDANPVGIARRSIGGILGAGAGCTAAPAAMPAIGRCASSRRRRIASANRAARSVIPSEAGLGSGAVDPASAGAATIGAGAGTARSNNGLAAGVSITEG